MHGNYIIIIIECIITCIHCKCDYLIDLSHSHSSVCVHDSMLYFCDFFIRCPEAPHNHGEHSSHFHARVGLCARCLSTLSLHKSPAHRLTPHAHRRCSEPSHFRSLPLVLSLPLPSTLPCSLPHTLPNPFPNCIANCKEEREDEKGEENA